MVGGYERVNARDDEDAETPVSATPRQHAVPNSPPPSFHSRSSSRTRGRAVDPDLADAFDADGDETDDETDDRQRLVRSNTSPTSRESSQADLLGANSEPQQPLQVTARQYTGPAAGRVYGGGIQSDGVFSNLTAKPERGQPEKEEQPPTYEQAAADSAPPYWETTILAPGLGGPDEVYIDGLPVGSLFSFVWNAVISMSFQLIGFILTYLLHSTHAAKNGSRAGLGVTLIQFGFMMKAPSSSGAAPPQMNGPDGYANPPDPNSHDFDPNAVAGDGGGGGMDNVTGAEWMAYVLMIVGWFILIRSVADYLQARRHEQLVLQSPDRGLPVPIIAEGESTERVV